MHIEGPLDWSNPVCRNNMGRHVHTYILYILHVRNEFVTERDNSLILLYLAST